MVDLFIDGAALASTQTTLNNIRETLSGAASAMSSTPSDVTADDTLLSRLTSFGGDWKQGIDELAEVSGSGAQALGVIADSFATLDAELAAALEQETPATTGPVAV